jgi:hypothetical protein
MRGVGGGRRTVASRSAVARFLVLRLWRVLFRGY